MSIALERNNTSDHRIQLAGFIHGMACIPVCKPPEFGDDDERSSSSSIGRNSDDSPAGRSSSDSGNDEEVQSAFGNLEALEEVLPIKRSISKFYAGKSKSFTSLASAASCSSLKDIVKPEDAYSRKRKNLLAYNNFFDKNGNNFSKSTNTGGLYKRPTTSRSSLALAATSASCSESNNSSESLNSSPPSLRISLPPLPPQSKRYISEASLIHTEQKFNAWRSFSVSDLTGVKE